MGGCASKPKTYEKEDTPLPLPVVKETILAEVTIEEKEVKVECDQVYEKNIQEVPISLASLLLQVI